MSARLLSWHAVNESVPSPFATIRDKPESATGIKSGIHAKIQLGTPKNDHALLIPYTTTIQEVAFNVRSNLYKNVNESSLQASSR